MPPARRRPLPPSTQPTDQTSRAPLPPDRRPFSLNGPTPTTTMITSPHNDKLKEVRRLQRRHEARFVAEGEDLLDAAERAGWRPVYRLEAGVGLGPELLPGGSRVGPRPRRPRGLRA